MKASTDRDGYKYVVVRHEGRHFMIRIHRAVAEGWLDTPPLEIVDHIDGDPGNNDVANLRWGTVMQNTRWARERKNWSSQPPIDSLKVAICKTLVEQYSHAAVAKIMRVSVSTVSRYARC